MKISLKPEGIATFQND